MSRLLKIITFFVFAFLSLIIISKNTANAACTKSPSIVYRGTTDGDWSVIYHLRLVDNCSGTNNYRVSVTNLPIQGSWEVENNGKGNTYSTNVSGSKDIDVTVYRNKNVYQADGQYNYVVVRTSLSSNSSVNDEIRLVYIIVNKPDLEVTNFNYPSGSVCGQSDATVRIKNTGWKNVTGNFDVRVVNGNGNLELHRVTQTVSHNETVNLDQYFRNMPRPPAGNWTATAKVDFGNEIREEDESNNVATDNYTTSICPSSSPTRTATPTRTLTSTPTPTLTSGTFRISGGVFLDNGGATGSKESGEPYTNGSNGPTGTIRIAGKNYTSGGTGFISDPLPRGTYNVSYQNFPTSGYSLTFPTNASVPPSVNVTIGSPCTDGGGDSVCVNGNIQNLNFGIRPDSTSSSQWFQSVGGDVRFDKGITDIIPSGSYLSDIDTSLGLSTSGVVFLFNPFDLGNPTNQNSRAGNNGWLVRNTRFAPPTIHTSYSQVLSRISRAGLLRDATSLFGGSTSPCGGTGPDCNLKTGLARGIYTSDRRVVLDSGSEYKFGTGNYVFLINGDLVIKNNITVPNGSTAIFIVSGNITIEDNVTVLEGMFSADKDFTVNNAGTGTGQNLIIRGNVIGNATRSGGQFTNNRDLGSENTTTPSVQVIFRPDFILNAPQYIQYTNFLRTEVAPGR